MMDSQTEKNIIKFTANDSEISVNTYPIIFNDDGIDYFSTLNQVKKMDLPALVVLEESYLSKFDGIILFTRLRLSYFLCRELSRCPCVILIKSELNDIIRFSSFFSLLFSKNTYVVKNLSELDIKKIVYLEISELKEILDNHPLKIPTGIDHHDLANEWGAFQLSYAYKALKNRQFNLETNIQNIKILLDREYYLYLLSSVHLENDLLNTRDMITRTKLKKYNSWLSFLRKYNSEKINISVIDDQLEQGWQDSLLEIVSEVNSVDYTFIIPKDDPIDYENILKDITQNTDLILCDIRLIKADKSTSTYMDVNTLETISGIRLIEKIKYRYPTLPIIAFTASDKVWMIKYLMRRKGIIDGYWIKENPDKNINNEYSVNNAIELMDLIAKNVEQKRMLKFLWDLVNTVNENILRKEFIGQFEKIRSSEFIVKRLESTTKLLIRAYGILRQERTQLEKDKFLSDPIQLSFIHVWGCLNEVLWLRFIIPPKSDAYMLNNEGKEKRFAKYDSLTDNYTLEPFVMDLLNSEAEKINPKRSYKPTDAAYLLLFLKTELEDKSLINAFESCRSKRNRIDFIHGDSVKKEVEITIDDIRIITTLIKKVLML